MIDTLAIVEKMGLDGRPRRSGSAEHRHDQRRTMREGMGNRGDRDPVRLEAARALQTSLLSPASLGDISQRRIRDQPTRVLFAP
ncbi:hypothetical protein [Trinickia sp. EG282A]|uniref:hypothetical protein n=1 Tax=Trinickia sp. EG282A TaxID=3237013 RepID=UPI0034D3823E